MDEQSRRDLLKGGLGIVGGAVGLGAIPTAATAAVQPARLELELKGIELRAHVHGRGAGRLPQPNDHLHVHGQVLDKAGRPAGTFTSTGVVIRSSVTGQCSGRGTARVRARRRHDRRRRAAVG